VAGGLVVVATALLAGRAPLATLLGAAGAVVVGLGLVRPQAALLLLIATGPLESAVLIPENAALTPVKVAGAFCFAAFAFDVLVNQRRIRFDRSHAVLGLLLALALVSSLAARSTPDALTTTVRYASFAGLYFVATQRADRRLAVRIVWILSAASALAAVLAVRRFLSGEALLAGPVNGDSNDLAFILATTLPLTFWLLRTKGLLARIAVLVMVAAISLGVLLSLSRGALLALAVAGVFHAATERRHIPVLLFGGAVTMAVALFVAGSAADRINEGLTVKSHIADENVETRLDAWHAAVELATDRPLLGVGPNNFGFYYFEKTGRPPGTFGLRVVHDAYLDVAAELGFTGLVLFGSYLAITFARATSAVRRKLGPPGLASSVRTALVVAMVAALTLSEQYFPPFWVLGALATVLFLEGEAEWSSSTS
jgi:O-antigen ligase